MERGSGRCFGGRQNGVREKRCSESWAQCVEVERRFRQLMPRCERKVGFGNLVRHHQLYHHHDLCALTTILHIANRRRTFTCILFRASPLVTILFIKRIRSIAPQATLRPKYHRTLEPYLSIQPKTIQDGKHPPHFSHPPCSRHTLIPLTPLYLRATGLLLLHPSHLRLPHKDQTGRRRIGASLSSLQQCAGGPSQGANLVRTLLDPAHPDEEQTHLHLQHLPVAEPPGRRFPAAGGRRRLRRSPGVSAAAAAVRLRPAAGSRVWRISAAEALKVEMGRGKVCDRTIFENDTNLCLAGCVTRARGKKTDCDSG